MRCVEELAAKQRKHSNYDLVLLVVVLDGSLRFVCVFARVCNIDQ